MSPSAAARDMRAASGRRTHGCRSGLEQFCLADQTKLACTAIPHSVMGSLKQQRDGADDASVVHARMHVTSFMNVAIWLSRRPARCARVADLRADDPRIRSARITIARARVVGLTAASNPSFRRTVAVLNIAQRDVLSRTADAAGARARVGRNTGAASDASKQSAGNNQRKGKRLGFHVSSFPPPQHLFKSRLEYQARRCDVLKLQRKVAGSEM